MAKLILLKRKKNVKPYNKQEAMPPMAGYHYRVSN